MLAGGDTATLAHGLARLVPGQVRGRGVHDQHGVRALVRHHLGCDARLPGIQAHRRERDRVGQGQEGVGR